jgi:diguanylate cyclase (GGDEF)-like protein
MAKRRQGIGSALCGAAGLLAPGIGAAQDMIGLANGAAADAPDQAPALAWMSLVLVCVVLATLAFRWRHRALHQRIRDLEGLVDERTQAIARREEELARLAYFDPLTGLPNQRMFREQLRRLIAGRRRGQGGFTMLLIELDGFREIQAAFGAAVGDALLSALGEQLRGLLRGNDTAARLGGNEFAVLLGQTTEPAAIESACARIVAKLGEPLLVAGHQLNVGASVGVVPCPTGDASPDELWRAADGALNEAKQAGPSTWRWGTAESYTFTA